jgi:hypothetical protein
MKAPVHILAGLAALSFLPDAVYASSEGARLPWLLAALAATLPDAAEALWALLPRSDATLTPEPGGGRPRAPDVVLADLGKAVSRSVATQHPLRLLVRPLPASCGTLRLRFLTGRVEADVSGRVATLPLPVARGPWPATVEVSAPWGVVLRLAPSPRRKPPAADIRLVSPPGRGVFHSPVLLLWIPLAGLLCGASSLSLQAVFLGLLSHGLLDVADSRGLPGRSPYLPGMGPHLWRTGSHTAERLATLASAALLLANLVRHTAYLPHRNSLLGCVLLAAAALLLFLAQRIGYTTRR